MSKTTEEVVKVGEREARRLLMELGQIKRGNLDLMQLQRRLEMLPQGMGRAEDLPPDLKVLFKKVTQATADDVLLIVEPHKPEVEEDEVGEDESESGILETPDGEVEETLERLDSEEGEEDTTPSDYVPPVPPFRKVGKPKIKTADARLARFFNALPNVPNGRSLRKKKVRALKEAIVKGEYRGNEWATVKCHEDGKTYRANGNTSSKAVLELTGNKPPVPFPPFTVVVQEYEADTLEGVALLYSTFDTQASSRTKVDQVKAFAGGVDGLNKLTSRALTIATAGIAFSKYETKYRRVPAPDQGSMLVANSEFACWMNNLMPPRKVGKPKKGEKGEDKAEHLRRMPVVAAMFKSYQKDQGDASDFWMRVRDGSDDSMSSPVGKLREFLMTHRCGAPRRDATRTASEREMFIKCLLAWNAWRNQEATVKLDYDKDAPTPDVE